MKNSTFKIHIFPGNTTITYTPTEYPDGAVRVNLDITELLKHPRAEVTIDAHIKDSKGLVALPSLCKYLRQLYETKYPDDKLNITVNMPYIPHARQDRYSGNNAFTLAYSSLPLIAESTIDHLIVSDPHSSVSTSLLQSSVRKLTVLSQLDLLIENNILQQLRSENFDGIVAPDNGAIERALSMLIPLGLDPAQGIITLSKTRDPNTGRISFDDLDPKTIVPKNVVMFDDIGDGCWTHVLAAEALKKAGAERVTLVLTHGLLTKGLSHLSPAIDSLYTIYNWDKHFVFKPTLNF